MKLKISDEIDIVVDRAIRGMRGYKTNAEIRSAAERIWPKNLARFDPSPERVAKSMVRLGYKPWRDRGARGYCVDRQAITVYPLKIFTRKKLPHCGI